MKNLLRSVIVLIICILIVVSVISVEWTSDDKIIPNRTKDDTNSPLSGPESENNPSISAEIDTSAQFNYRNSSIQVTVIVSFSGYNNIHFEDVMVCLYDQGGNILYAEKLGTISLRSRDQFIEEYEIYTEISQRPYYITVHHPGFINDSRINVETLVSYDNRYTNSYQHLGEIQDRFEYPQSSEPGECG